MILRPYQGDLKTDILAKWAAGFRNVLAVLPTGGGKTVVFADIIRGQPGATVCIAHRQEIVTQISLSLARNGVRHRIIGPPAVVKLAVSLHMEHCGTSYYQSNAPAAVAGIDTLIRRTGPLHAWLRTVQLWVMDEAHHVLKENKWGKGVSLFPNARGLGVTATPKRADGRGLGKKHDGVFDCLVEGPGMRELITQGFLTDYQIFAPEPEDLDLDAIPLGVSGDYIHKHLTKAVRGSRIVGDVVPTYLQNTPGMRGATFTTDVQTAHDIADAYNAANIPAVALSAKTPDAERIAQLRKLRHGDLLQVCNVDLFGEGFDLPALELVTMVRPTQSFVFYCQAFGRMLRIMDGKTIGTLTDHVGNVMRHGLPDRPQHWTLERRTRRSKGVKTDPGVKVCPNCTRVYDKRARACPVCGYAPKPLSRSSPKHVEGDLTLMDPAVLAQMRGEIAQADLSAQDFAQTLHTRRVPTLNHARLIRLNEVKRIAREQLRVSIDAWAGVQIHKGLSVADSYRAFYLTYGVDVLTAQTFGAKEMETLTEKLAKVKI